MWKDGKMCGRGVYRNSTGATYDGDFLDDKRHGKGHFISGNGVEYEGDWEDGRIYSHILYANKLHITNNYVLQQLRLTVVVKKCQKPFSVV